MEHRTGEWGVLSVAAWAGGPERPSRSPWARPFTFHLSPRRPSLHASRKPNLALRQHRLQTPKHDRERLPIILNSRLGLLAPVQAIDEMFE
jgi:hypothetical protein